MNNLRNSVTLIGRLGQNPEIRTLDKGTKVATVSLATDDSFTDKDGNRQKQVQWHSLVLWGRLAERAEKFMLKGKEVAVEGRIAYRNWEDKNGAKHNACEIVVNEFLLLGSNK